MFGFIGDNDDQANRFMKFAHFSFYFDIGVYSWNRANNSEK